MAKVGPYELLDEIARGGMGVVYRARGSKGEVALKLLHDARIDPRFQQEVRAISALDTR